MVLIGYGLCAVEIAINEINDLLQFARLVDHIHEAGIQTQFLRLEIVVRSVSDHIRQEWIFPTVVHLRDFLGGFQSILERHINIHYDQFE